MAIIFVKKGKTNWKYLLIIFILGVIVGAGSLWLSQKQTIPITQLQEIKKPERPSQDETANWNTYKNEKYGFEFKYPPELQIGGGDDEEIWGSYGGQSVNVSIEIVPFQDFSTLHPTWREMSSRIKNINQINATEYYNPNKEGSINDKRFVYISLPNQNQKQIEIFVEVGFGNATENFNNILSTFKFIEKDDTADWKTYRNEKYGFELKYPKDLRYTSTKDGITLFSTPFSCETEQSDGKVEVNDFKITFKLKSGSSYNQIWKDTFGFDFNRNSYDGTQVIGGKTAYYFFQGAEMAMPCTFYLVELTSTTVMEITTYVLERGMVSNCTPPLEGDTNKLRELGSGEQILSTFRFLE